MNGTQGPAGQSEGGVKGEGTERAEGTWHDEEGGEARYTLHTLCNTENVSSRIERQWRRVETEEFCEIWTRLHFYVCRRQQRSTSGATLCSEPCTAELQGKEKHSNTGKSK